MSGAFYNTAAGRYGASADIPPYTIRAALAAVLGLLLLLTGISEIIYNAIVHGILPMTGDDGLSRGISSLVLGSLIPVIPGVPAIIHSIRVKRLLEAGDELEARRASNYARTWSRIALWTWIGLAVSWVVFVLTLAAALAFILIVIVALLLAGVFFLLAKWLGPGLGGVGGVGSGGRESDSIDGGDSGRVRDDGRRRRPGQRYSEESVRIRQIQELQKQREQREQRRRWRR